MSEDIDQPPEWVAHVETPHTPGLVGRSIDHLDPRFDDALMDIIEIVHLDR